MRICIVYQGEFPRAERIEKFAKTLATAGHEVFLLCNNYGAFGASEERFGDVHTVRVIPTWSSRRVNKILKFPIFLNPLWLFWLIRVVRRFHIDVLQVIDVPLSIGVLAVGRMFKIPVVFDMWENYPEALRGWGKSEWTTRLFKNHHVARIVERWVTPRVDHVFTVVEEQRNRLISLGVRPDRVSVVTNAIDPDLFASLPLRDDLPLDSAPDAYRLLFVGAITVERGLDDIIRALPLVRPHIPGVRLYIGGAGNDETRLRRIAEHENVQDIVHFLGWIAFDQIRSYIQKADLCLVPHVYNDFINTTIPNKLFQYMALAKPVLVSHAKPLARVVRESSCGFVFQSGDPLDAAEKIREAYGLRCNAEIGQRGRECVERQYTWEIVSRELVRVYAEINHTRSSP